MRTQLQLTLLAALAAACTVAPEKSGSRLNDADNDAAAKAAWIEKAAAALRNGDALGPADDVDQLLEMSREDIVKKLMADPRFGDTMLSFNLFYLGRSVNTLKTADLAGQTGRYKYDEMVYAMPQALASARAMMEGGDYFAIYGATPPLYMAPLGPASGYDANFQPLQGTDAEKRAKLREQVLKIFDDSIKGFETPVEGQTGLNKQAGCQAFQYTSYNIQYSLQNAGFDSRLGQQVYQAWLMPIVNYFPAGYCMDQNVAAEIPYQAIKAARAGVDAIFAKAETLPSGGGIKHLGELAKLEIDVQGLPSLSNPLTSKGFWEPLRNSSTNFNRKRAAYMLRTYFCDDLTPISVEVMTPTGNTQNQHASDPACQACHYKLDPMGGLFRNIGQNGTDFTGQTQYTFDDFKTINGQEFTDYLASWKGETEGTWKAGYYVGANKPHAKWQGNTLKDMWTFLPQSKEARQCLVRRMAEYFLGPQQVYDGQWLDEISAALKPGATSSAAVKKVVTSLVLSKTFATQNPEAGKCYDFASDEEEAGGGDKAPCEVASIVRKHCAGCHDDADGGGVDFTKWPWPHQDDNGTTLSKTESFKIIIDRLTTTNPLKRMPKGGQMSEMERQVLYKWLDKQISN